MLVSPRDHLGERLRYAVLEYTKLIDSSEITQDDWIRIASG